MTDTHHRRHAPAIAPPTLKNGGCTAPAFTLVIDLVPTPRQRRALPAGVTVRPDPLTTMVGLRFDLHTANPHTANPHAVDPTTVDLAEAVTNAVNATERVGLRVLRVDATDWVTRADIAHRIGRTRETVRLWVAGRVGPGGFPPPVNPDRDTLFYSWAEVSIWLREHQHLDLPDDPPVLAVANLLLQLRTLAARLDTPSPLWRLAPAWLDPPTPLTTAARP
jgi:hypothetical protein